MKKEIFAGALLLAILITSVININCLNKLTDNLISLVETAEEEALSGDWEAAAAGAEKAARIWAESDSYTHVVLRHHEIDGATNAIYELLKEIYSQNEGGVRGASKALIAHLDSMRSMEEIKFGSIF